MGHSGRVHGTGPCPARRPPQADGPPAPRPAPPGAARRLRRAPGGAGLAANLILGGLGAIAAPPAPPAPPVVVLPLRAPAVAPVNKHLPVRFALTRHCTDRR